jgi:hypothetical protein
MSRWRKICGYCVSDGVPRRSFVVADVNLAKIILTFAVPYCVATYGAVSYRLQAGPSGGSAGG